MKRFTLLVVLSVACAALAPAFAQTAQDPVPQQQKREHGKGRRHGKHFGKLDKNNDGQIARDEWTRKPEAFERLDANKDGFITKDELQNARKNRGDQQPQ